MNTLDLLLQLDESKLKKPCKEVNMKRLSELTGERVIFKIEALTPAKMEEIQEMAMDETMENINVSELQIMTILEGVKEPNFKSKELMDKFGVYTPKDLIRKILLPGEIITLYNIIGDLSGFDGGAVEEVKNS
ncbi:MAG: XkdN-like protein [Clostridia bacterium]|nr:XkdN-like protein [Clostridia bacterium]